MTPLVTSLVNGRTTDDTAFLPTQNITHVVSGGIDSTVSYAKKLSAL